MLKSLLEVFSLKRNTGISFGVDFTGYVCVLGTLCDTKNICPFCIPPSIGSIINFHTILTRFLDFQKICVFLFKVQKRTKWNKMVKLTAVVDGAKGYEKETHSKSQPSTHSTVGPNTTGSNSVGWSGVPAGANRTHPETEYLVWPAPSNFVSGPLNAWIMMQLVGIAASWITMVWVGKKMWGNMALFFLFSGGRKWWGGAIT